MSKANKVLVALGLVKEIGTKGKAKLSDGKEILLSTETLGEDTVAFESEGVLLSDGDYETEAGQKFSIKDGATSITEVEEVELESDYVTKAEFAEAIGKIVDVISKGQEESLEKFAAQFEAKLSKVPTASPSVDKVVLTEQKSYDLKDPMSFLSDKLN